MMKYLVTINAIYFEISKSFEKIIRSFFQERMKDFLIIHNDTENYLSIFLAEDLPDEVRTELLAYFNIRLKVFEINQPLKAVDFQQLCNIKQFKKEDIVGLYETSDEVTYPYLQLNKRVYFLNPLDSKLNIQQKYHDTAIKGVYPIQNGCVKRVGNLETHLDYFFDHIKDITNPAHFIYELFQIPKSPYLNLTEFEYSQSNHNGFTMYYNDGNYEIIVSIHEVNKGIPYGNIDLMYQNIHPFRSKAYTKERKETLEKYLVELGRKEEVPYYPFLNFTHNTLTVEGINLHNPDYYAVIGGLFNTYDEKFIPKCFDKQAVKDSYEHFKSFETLYQLKNSHKFVA